MSTTRGSITPESEPHGHELKSERFVWSGVSTTFQDKALQRRTRDKIEHMMEQVAADSNDTNALIALKVLKYRKLSNHTATRCLSFRISRFTPLEWQALGRSSEETTRRGHEGAETITV
ncbi:hypothetical protein PHYPSEUDO_002384 [Phytophthora pseudosyringae]|uniref:Uncharacterized protein n=1 Tax=Phytophthora pseudosyringae TaxID=221518 RepID=A0A8T1VU11_9STRA|nr:hypothetical protein PHYPSEUDO_002384 [Phytophthora pseudosyringae]